MNEIQLAGMADRLQKMATIDGIHRFVTTSKDINQREADLVNRELARRGVDMQVVLAISIEAALTVGGDHSVVTNTTSPRLLDQNMKGAESDG